MAKASDVVKKLQKVHGGAVARIGVSDYEDVIRIPTGIFQFDLATGGGFPRGKCSEIYGPESSGKTNLLIRAMANAQRLWPEKKCVLIDAEHSLDPAWAEKLGLDLENLILCDPDYAEQAIDMVIAFIYADDVSVIGLDSIAALCTQNEAEKSAEIATMGGSSAKVGGLYRKLVVGMQQLRNQGLQPPGFIAINQIRHKLNVMFGNPETTPGGNAPRFAAAMRARTYGKPLADKKIHPAMPFAKTTSFQITKWKVPILANVGTYTMNMLPVPSGKYAGPVGHVDEWNTLSHYMMELGYLEQVGSKWKMMDKEYTSAVQCKAALYEDFGSMMSLKQMLIAELLDKGVMLGGSEDENDAGKEEEA